MYCTCQLLSTDSGQMTKVGLGPRCAVFFLLDCGDDVTCGTVGFSSTVLPANEAKINRHQKMQKLVLTN